VQHIQGCSAIARSVIELSDRRRAARSEGSDLEVALRRATAMLVIRCSKWSSDVGLAEIGVFGTAPGDGEHEAR